MTHRVIEGSAGNLTVVRPADLPTNADHSYLRYVQLVGKWGAKRSLRYVDIVDSVVDADLTLANVNDIESRHSNWDGATLTPEQTDTFYCSVDILRGFIAPAYKDYFVNTIGVSATAMTDALSHDRFLSFTDEERRSWFRILARWTTEMGLTKRQIVEGLDAVFSVLPASRKYIMEAQPLGTATTALTVIFFEGAEVTYIAPDKWSPDMRTAHQRHDRWALARACEKWADDTHGLRVKAFCKSIFPTFDFKAINLDASNLYGEPDFGA